LKNKNEKIIDKEKKQSGEVSRRDFLVGAGSVLAAGAVGGGLLAGCEGETTTTTKTVEIPTTKTVSTTVEVPTTVTTQGPVSTVTTTKTVTGTGGETTVTTTVTSGGYSFETIPDPIPDSQIKETITSDIVVIGAGISGLPAAMKAAELGATVQVVEKGPSVGEPRSGPASFTNKMMRAAGVELDRDEVIGELMANAICINAKQDLFALWCDKSGEWMDWQLDILEAAGFTPTYDGTSETAVTKSGYWTRYSWNIQFSPAERFAPTVNYMIPMMEYAVDKGAIFNFNTTAKQLIRQNNGQVTGVVVQNEDGDYVKYNANKGVILASGDIGRSDEMMAKYYPNGLNVAWNFCNKNNTGDGHKMGMWIGADMEDFCSGGLMWGATTTGKTLWTTGNRKNWAYSPAVGTMSMLYVDIAGNRCVNEGLSIKSLPFAVMSQPEHRIWAVWDSAWESKVPANYPAGFSSINTQEQVEIDVAEGITLKADTLDELIEKMGVSSDNFYATLDRYHEICAEGYDPDFMKGASWLTTIDTPPYYAASIGADMFVTWGGLKINTKLQALDKNGLVIPGLYIVGSTAGGFYGPAYPLGLGGFESGHCFCTGYLAAKSAVTGEV
jgi:hypothetical protein